MSHPLEPALDRRDSVPADARMRHLRRYVYSLNHVGVIGGLLFFVVSLTPSLLPRTWYVQGLLSGITVAGGYGLGVLLHWIVRHLGMPRAHETVRHVTWRVLWIAWIVTVPLMLWLSSGWQAEIRRAVHYPASGRFLYVPMFLVAAVVAALLVGIVRLLHDLSRLVARLIGRWLPPVVSRSIAAVLVGLLAYGFATGVIGTALRALADRTFESADHGNYAGVTQPATPQRSGSPASLVRWDELGKEGRAFVAQGPTAAEITALTGRPAITPIRVYAGRESADSLRGEAELVVRELQRTGAFRRAVIAVCTSTGTGWIDPSESDPLEYMYGGNTAIASMQYSYFPSWMSFLIDRSRAQAAGRALFDAVSAQWRTLPAGHRPKLVVFGESLGTYGATAPFASLDDLVQRTDGAVFTGPPNSTPLWRHWVDHRRPGSSERLPVYGDGQQVRFANDASDLREKDGSLGHPHVVVLQHASDPVVWWSWDLLWHKPQWLNEGPGPDTISALRWRPFISFWQLTCDLIAATSPPPGHGHNYGAEVIAAWTAVLHPPGWTAHDAAVLAQI